MKPLLLLLVLTSSTVAVHALTQQLLARHTHTGHAGRLDGKPLSLSVTPPRWRD